MLRIVVGSNPPLGKKLDPPLGGGGAAKLILSIFAHAHTFIMGGGGTHIRANFLKIRAKPIDFGASNGENIPRA